jgi:SAM-dependent methyltransferase
VRYHVNGFQIRSENAAKPACAAGKWVLDWISTLPPDGAGLDLGCGKLRYTIHLARRLCHVTAVDSREQVDRAQRLFGTSCSVREYAARHLGNVRVCSLDEDTWPHDRYSVILCSNVLSAIPSLSVRRQLMTKAYDRLCPNGELLVTTQYRNSHYASWEGNPRARRFLDGFLVEHTRGASFYGLIDSAALARLCRRVGFAIIRSGHAKELAYVFARRADGASLTRA